MRTLQDTTIQSLSKLSSEKGYCFITDLIEEMQLPLSLCCVVLGDLFDMKMIHVNFQGDVSIYEEEEENSQPLIVTIFDKNGEVVDGSHMR